MKIRIKPSKGVSLLGFVVGIVFVFIGVTLVIPNAGLFGTLWTIIAIAITCINGINAFTKKEFDEALNMSTEEYKKMIIEKLSEIYDLYDKNLISKEEFEKRRKNIVDKI